MYYLLIQLCRFMAIKGMGCNKRYCKIANNLYAKHNKNVYTDKNVFYKIGIHLCNKNDKLYNTLDNN